MPRLDVETVTITWNECILDRDAVPVATKKGNGTLLYLNTDFALIVTWHGGFNIDHTIFSISF